MLCQLHPDRLKDRCIDFIEVRIVWHADAMREAVGFGAYLKGSYFNLRRPILA